MLPLVVPGVTEGRGIEDVVAEAQDPGGLARDGELVAGDHLHVDPHGAGPLDRVLRGVPRRVEERQHAEEGPGPLALRP